MTVDPADDLRYYRRSVARCEGLAPRDPHAYDALVNRIGAAPTADALLALVPDVVAFEGDAFRDQFGESWNARWAEVAGDREVPADAWPPADWGPR